MSTKHEEIAETLTEEILSHRFRPGERLPSERDLASRFQANRGAVREAMKKIAQLGLASIQPGGARVEPIQRASLDVIGSLLQRGDIPEAQLVEQVLETVHSLVDLAVSRVLDHATEAEMNEIRAALTPLKDATLDEQAHALARVELMRRIMITSNHLICQLIARTLLEQLVPNLEKLHGFAEFDRNTHRNLVVELDEALRTRNRQEVARVFAALGQINLNTILAALEAANRANTQAPHSEVSAQ